MTTLGVTPPTVIVATEHESTVRLYVGHPSNGGMHQTGQFTTAHPIDPTELANMAVDLSASFGWLNGAVAVAAEPVEAPAPAALPPAAPVINGRKNATDRLACPLDSSHIVSRQNMHRHLTTNQHGLTYSQATALVRELPATPRTDLTPRTEARARKQPPKSSDKWQAIVACPYADCSYTGRRNNMMSHLQTSKHGLTRDQAAARVKTLPALTDTPPREPSKVKAPSAAPRGKAGQLRLRNEIFPRILRLMNQYTHPVSTTAMARRLGATQSQTTSWMHKLAERGDIVCTNTETRTMNEPMTYVLASRVVEATPPAHVNVTAPAHDGTWPVGDNQSLDSPTGTEYDDDSSTTVHERNEPE